MNFDFFYWQVMNIISLLEYLVCNYLALSNFTDISILFTLEWTVFVWHLKLGFTIAFVAFWQWSSKDPVINFSRRGVEKVWEETEVLPTQKGKMKNEHLKIGCEVFSKEVEGDQNF